ncbi:MAG: histidinol dehydrogenase, partial [Candidatus Thiodiazotropha sp. (ex Cardiolucina cf. quadrata)]|nr:histidinol dehydrogenase [Candidatus Thiodiazotropha sp. (ex Cardiolucina cf. quadrata)]
MSELRQLSTNNSNFQQQLDKLLAWESVSDTTVNDTVNQIIHTIRIKGDSALVDFTNRFDRWQADSAADLEIPLNRLEQAWHTIPANQQEALKVSANRVRAYAEHQTMESWSYTEPDGTLLGQQVTPLDRVGLYVPGGKA